MSKALYDSTLHIGQFSGDPFIKTGCKNVLARMQCKSTYSKTSDHNIQGVITYSEIAETDTYIRKHLSRKEQDMFYIRMDVFYSVKDIDIIRDGHTTIKQLSLTIEEQLLCGYHVANNITTAVETGCSETYTLYPQASKVHTKDYVQKTYGISIKNPYATTPLYYTAQQTDIDKNTTYVLEKLYTDAYNYYQTNQKDIAQKMLHTGTHQ